MEGSGRLVVFSIDGQRFGLDVLSVKRIVPAVEVTPVPGSPDHLLGLISVKGSDVPVLNMRRLLGFPGRAVAARDKMILAEGPERDVALVVDEIAGFADSSGPCPTEGDSPAEMGGLLAGTLKDDDGMILICKEELLLASGEAKDLDATRGRE